MDPLIPGAETVDTSRPRVRGDGPAYRDFNLDAEESEPQSRRAHEDVVRDPALDEELEIPAFLRRQMNPR